MDWQLPFNVTLEMMLTLIVMWPHPEIKELKGGGHFMLAIGQLGGEIILKI